MQGFMSPFEVAAPEGVGGWESMYPYYALFRENEEQRGWFRDGMHFPEPIFPFDFVTADSPYMSLGQANSRIFLVPPALGIDHRVLYGWVYMSPNGVADPEEIGRRAQLAIGMGLAEQVKSAADEDSLRAALGSSTEGRDWLADWDGTKEPWFNYSN